ncbi:hypothetical protein pEaSNUABM50_00516 [Erwinia phage pEa_SNUABM_50]|uniref:Uncharacterized protein n=4 Tax=Eneladusvirus BF TaxID=2560751 RepID=A0A7L8ZN99_9CAUD|nr:hypothetical protein FDH34_gp428 [Serratia phage BF]QOI71457.1 hypothetical protein pEaSNUABM12_00540 [Erwinia phage pEa_SNUABM_12]QOI71966.1 hypothetical protein pEaSNUABM47_00517 [Erwinia phage pEa_SNUABM_47]QOI72506.1 hypothetical protein pEaSNUABM50_00516 [Erwinia phage pEa_SNUABM_50]QXO11637.1 hypothetical protein pEaSNUABM19_00526 [Erwinia phage pEa_SNUABM_19]AQW89017.1 hypothetical protein BF_0492 [Serratia phage BF]
MWQVIVFFILFQIFYSIANNAFVFRSIYAFKLAQKLGWKSFFKFYFESYLVYGDAINAFEHFLPEVNDRLEKLLALALNGEAQATISWDRWGEQNYLNIQAPRNFDTNSSSISFYYLVGKINSNEKYLLSPSVFFIANKLIKKLEDKKAQEKLDSQKRTI